ncbi:MAG: hypothetical protein IKO49_00155 [Bacilli bacterium]|nr:hypothetical protein [Bacilli bacterium]
MLFESLKYDSVRTFLQQLLIQDKYKNIEAPYELKEAYYLDGKYAFFLGIDALSKYEQIVGDMSLIDDYVEQLKRVFKKFSDYNDIKNGVYTLILKVISVKLSITNTNSFESREKILHYVYNKYIINGYFYFGFMSNHINEISCVGIRHDGFVFDSKLDEINDIFNRYSNNKLFIKKDVNLTDDIMVALYYAFLSPNYLSSMVVNPLLKNKKYDRDCFYTKDILKIKEILMSVCNSIHLNNEDKLFVINRFIDVYVSSHVNNVHPCIARIKRSSIGKDKLKDIEEIVHNNDESLISLMELILDSRYMGYDLNSDIMPDDIEIVDIPTYNDFMIGKNEFVMITDDVLVEKSDLEVNDSLVTQNVAVNSYGAVSVAIVGLLFIIIGVVMTMILYFMGG